MNIALSSIFLVILMLPGILFIIGFYGIEPFTLKHINISFSKLIPSIIIPSLVIQALSILVLSKWYVIDIKKAILFLSGDIDQIKAGVDAMNGMWSEGIIYFIGTSLSGVLLGFLLWFFIRIVKLDRRIHFLRFPNRWYYILTGENIDFPERKSMNTLKSVKRRNRGIFINALIKIESREVLYSGILESFCLSKGELGVEYIKLRSPYRFNFNKKGKIESVNDMWGKYLVLPFNEIINIDIDYFDKTKFIDQYRSEITPTQTQTPIS